MERQHINDRKNSRSSSRAVKSLLVRMLFEACIVCSCATGSLVANCRRFYGPSRPRPKSGDKCVAVAPLPSTNNLRRFVDRDERASISRPRMRAQNIPKYLVGVSVEKKKRADATNSLFPTHISSSCFPGKGSRTYCESPRRGQG